MSEITEHGSNTHNLGHRSIGISCAATVGRAFEMDRPAAGVYASSRDLPIRTRLTCLLLAAQEKTRARKNDLASNGLAMMLCDSNTEKEAAVFHKCDTNQTFEADAGCVYKHLGPRLACVSLQSLSERSKPFWPNLCQESAHSLADLWARRDRRDDERRGSSAESVVQHCCRGGRTSDACRVGG